MISLVDLWLPIVLAAVFVFVVSSVVHMVLQLHKNDFAKMPNEDLVLEALRKHGVGPGQYLFPCADSMKDMASPEMTAKYQRGPVGYAIVRASGAPTMGKALLQWFVYCLVVGTITAYASHLAFARGAAGMLVFRFAASVSLLGYGLYAAMDSIWKGARWSTTARYWLDGLLYALTTGATFAWLWPA